MKKININHLATEGVPTIATLLLPFFILIAFAHGWIHGALNTIFAAAIGMPCLWALGYQEWQAVKGRVSKALFGAYCISYCVTAAGLIYVLSPAVTFSTEASLLCIGALMGQQVIVGYLYNEKRTK